MILNQKILAEMSRNLITNKLGLTIDDLGSIYFGKNHKQCLANSLLMVRHGETKANAEKLMQGQNDEPGINTLSAEGIAQATKLGSLLSQQPIDLILTSPLKRAETTATLINNELKAGAGLIKLQGLTEFDYGLWSNQNEKTVINNYPERTKAFLENKINASAPQGESIYDLLLRANQIIDHINENWAGKNILIVSHKLTLTMLLVILQYKNMPLGDDGKILWQKFKMDNSEVIRIV